MKQILYVFPLSLCLILAACSSSKDAKPPAASIGVITEVIESRDVPISFEHVGFTNSSHEVDIRARISGYLDAIYEREGEHVEKNTVLFQIDPRPFEAALEDAKGDLAKQEAFLWESKRSVERLKPLFEKNAASRRDLDSAIAQELSNEALVSSSTARVKKAELDLDYTSIRAPISGEVGASNFRVGALVVANETLLTTLSVVDPIWINFSVPEREMLKYRHERLKGRLIVPEYDDFAVEVTLIDGGVVPEKGKVNFLSPTYDVKTGTMMVRATLPNTKKWLTPGQFVRVRVLGAIHPNAIIVPQRAVQQNKQGLFVYVVNAANKVETRYIEAGQWIDNGWIINAGVGTGDRVIIDGVNKVRAGSTVHELNPAKEKAL